MLLIVFYSEFTNSLDHLLMKKLLYILLSICLFYACSKKESDSSEILKDSIVISSNDKLVLEQKSCSAEIIFTSSGEWSARIDPNAATWCNIDKLQGLAGENTIIVSVSENTSYDERNASITLLSGKAKQFITITQKQKDAIVIAEDEYTMNATGGILEFTVNANVDFKIDIDADWIRQIVKARGLTEHTLIFEVSENTSVELRKAKIALKSDDCNQLITVVQQGNNLTDGNIDDMPIIPW